MSKLKIAILTGGNVAERGISLGSAKTVFNHLDEAKYDRYIIELNGTAFSEQSTGSLVDLNDFSLSLDGQKIRFDLIFLMLHGHPAEDGCLQGYFEVRGIPYTGCDNFVSALTFNKQATKDYLRTYGVKMADSQLLIKGQAINWEKLASLGLPLFVKPNKNGSSYGVSKVKQTNELEAAIQLAFQYDNEVVVEQFLDGLEFSNGIVRNRGEVVVLPITEIVTENEFFDYKAKYENESQEITPARLSPTETKQCQANTKMIYEVLGCKGMARIDYIKVGETFYFLEANTIPGMSEASIIPQQTLHHGWSISQLLEAIVEEAMEGVVAGRRVSR